jgi:hypothetical protein
MVKCVDSGGVCGELFGAGGGGEGRMWVVHKSGMDGEEYCTAPNGVGGWQSVGEVLPGCLSVRRKAQGASVRLQQPKRQDQARLA